MTDTPNFRDADALLPVVVQDATSSQVLMLAHMNRAAWDATLERGEAVYFSRSRNRLWHKGEESGNIQRVREIYVDCDEDAILLKVDQVGGAACHEGFPSCFFRRRVDGQWQVIAQRVFDPQTVYRHPSPGESQ